MMGSIWLNNNCNDFEKCEFRRQSSNNSFGTDTRSRPCLDELGWAVYSAEQQRRRKARGTAHSMSLMLEHFKTVSPKRLNLFLEEG